MSPYDDEEIIQAKDRYQLLVDSIRDYAIILLDSSGYVETWNIGAEKIKGYTADEAIGQHVSLFYPPSDTALGKPEKLMLRAAQEGSVEIEDWRVKKDGSRFWANVTVTALFNKSGSLIGFAKIVKDITDKKRSKNALIAANKLLKHQRLELESLNNVKDAFISLASHQLRTPATGIKQFLGLLLEGYAGPLTDQQMTYVQKAYASNERQIDLVNSLLRTAQIDAGKVILNKSPANLEALIREIVESLRDVFETRKQTVEIIATEQLSDIYIDQARMRMVFENLIDNASKYTDDGGRIVITLSQKNLYASISIRDTGVGVSESDIKHIFDKFNRIPNKLSDKAGGTGLGLYWAKRIVDLHKGTIKVHSQIDVGTEFIIRIPKDAPRE
ncbi:MAG: PAS domain-containing sensor histidine kinase [Candidatus Saccharimonadales bacterium]